MFLHENDLYMGDWVGRAPFFFHLKNRKKGCVAGGGGGAPRKNLLCYGGIDIFLNKVYMCHSVGTK